METYREAKETQENDFEKLFKEITFFNFEIGSSFIAKPTYIIDPHNFYIMPLPFIYHLASLSKPGNPFQAEQLKENRIVIFKSNNPKVNEYFKIDLDEHIRGVIQNVDKYNKCDIYALDRGFIEKDVSIERIYYTANEESLIMPGLVQRCELDLCSPIGPNFTAEAIDTFKYYLGNEMLSVVIRGKSMDKLKITAYNSNPDDIATLLAYAECTNLSCNIKEGQNAMTIKLF